MAMKGLQCALPPSKRLGGRRQATPSAFAWVTCSSGQGSEGWRLALVLGTCQGKLEGRVAPKKPSLLSSHSYQHKGTWTIMGVLWDDFLGMVVYVDVRRRNKFGLLEDEKEARKKQEVSSRLVSGREEREPAGGGA